MNEEVQVVGEVALVRSTTAELGQVIEMKQIQALPLNGRFFQHLISLTPGAMPFYSRGDSAENSSAAGARIATAHTVNGMPWSGNDYLLDGVINNEPQNAYINITPPLEAIQEFKVQSNNPTAEFGVFGGAAVNLSIRSGTNEIHGSVFDYLRDDALNTKTLLRSDQGPLQLESVRRSPWADRSCRTGRSSSATIRGCASIRAARRRSPCPTALMRQGNFTEIGDVIYDPLTGQPFAGNIIPAGAINPISRQVADIWPMPNRPGLANNYVENNVVTQDVNAGDLRLDYKLRGAASTFFRASRCRSGATTSPRPATSSWAPTTPTRRTTTPSSATRRPWAPTSSTSCAPATTTTAPTSSPRTSASTKNNELGIPNGNLPGHPETTGIASFRPSGFSNTGSPGTTNALRVGRTWHLTNNLTWVRGMHTMKTGADLRFVNGAVTNPQTQPQGRFSFDRNYTSRARRDRARATRSRASCSAIPTQVQRDIVDTYPQTDRILAGFFAQDDIRLNQKLSLQVGVRWDVMTPPIQPDNRQSNFNPTDGLIHLATDDNRGPDRTTHWDYVAPRIGVAYTPDKGKTAIRAAFGVSYFADNFGANGGTNERNYPFFQEVNLVSPTTFTPFRSVSDGLPTFTSVPLTTTTLTPPAGFAVFYIPADFHEDTVKMWNVGVQRELGWSTMADVSYVGHPRHEPVPVSSTSTCRRRARRGEPTPSLLRRRSQHHHDHAAAGRRRIVVRRASGEGGQALLPRAAGLVAYTWSKTEDNVAPAGLHPLLEGRADDRQQQGHRHSAHLRDQRHVGSAGGRGRRFMSDKGLGSLLLGGWSVSAITNYHSGDPLNIRCRRHAQHRHAATGRTSPAARSARRTPSRHGSTPAALPIRRSTSSATTRSAMCADRASSTPTCRCSSGPPSARARSRYGSTCSTSSTALISPTRTRPSATPRSDGSAPRGSPRVRRSWVSGSCSKSTPNFQLPTPKRACWP